MKGEKRFCPPSPGVSTHSARSRREQRQTGGQGLFRADDNLESHYARDALRRFYQLIYLGKVEGCSLKAFEDTTGLSLTSSEGTLLDELRRSPPSSTGCSPSPSACRTICSKCSRAFCFARIEGAIAAGVYDRGLETVSADSLLVDSRRTIFTHPASGATTSIVMIRRKDRNRPLNLDAALTEAQRPGAQLLVNERSGRAAVLILLAQPRAR